MLALLLLQIVVPLLLTLWIGFFGSKVLATFCMEVLAVFIALLSLIFTGLWVVPPWWTPYLLMLLLIFAVIVRAKKISTFELKLPQVIFGWLRLCLFLLLGIYFSTQLVAAMAGRTPPFETTAMNYPLPSGSYLVLSGGNHTAINAHLMTLDASVPRFQQWRGQSYALDIVQINNLGFRSAGFLPSDPAEYFIYGTEILAPCDGYVKSAVDGIADNQVPLANREAMTGNHVLISCNGVEVLLAHMIPNSVAVNAQDAVSIGDVLGKVGNSGNCNEPHLHIHVQVPSDSNELYNTSPLPIEIAGHYWLRNQIMVVP